ncbi:hypothetical protein EHW97_14830 [Aeromicrobium camelliae]|uniref:Uncharacterized protein n=1 Tax=Aeromicrobium camelliae TaxID=1538144 RepID=A0A3N6Z513_9ACTN|nr:hypothetical protein [Aeromicrobium camelliae]RQN02027.1 hypothetical protein EHW97_14830 [Aeromicrobium camelliae]
MNAMELLIQAGWQVAAGAMVGFVAAAWRGFYRGSGSSLATAGGAVTVAVLILLALPQPDRGAAAAIALFQDLVQALAVVLGFVAGWRLGEYWSRPGA